jgi:GTP cyclohydrolase II
MDSARSERFGARVVLVSGKRRRGVWLVPSDIGDVEPRFITLDPQRLREACAEIEAWAVDASTSGAEARARVQRLAALLEGAETLAQAARAIADELVRVQIGLDAHSTTAAEMVAGGLLKDSVEDYLANLDTVVAVFNETVAELIALDIDPTLRPLPDDHLPLRYSCPGDGTRMRLSRENRAGDMFAVATCDCGERYEFRLQRGRGALDELDATGRWSIDASMPVHHNDIASGWVAGQSTGLYALLFNAVLERVFGKRPIPILVPARLGEETPGEGDDEVTVLTRYLMRS